MLIARDCFIRICVADAERRQVPIALQKLPDEIVEAEFTPRSEGVHSVSVLIGDEHVQGSPFKIPVLDLSAVRVIGLKSDRVGVEQRFNGNLVASHLMHFTTGMLEAAFAVSIHRSTGLLRRLLGKQAVDIR